MFCRVPWPDATQAACADAPFKRFYSPVFRICGAPMVSIQELTRYLDSVLQTERFKDYCPNGLQVEGRDRIEHIVTGVTASQALLKAAHARNADAVLVHHGYFWKNEDPRITGIKRARLAMLLQITYHSRCAFWTSGIYQPICPLLVILLFWTLQAVLNYVHL